MLPDVLREFHHVCFLKQSQVPFIFRVYREGEPFIESLPFA